MIIQPIVEGHGEVPAVPVLLRRLIERGQVYQFTVASPIRRKRTELVAEASLRKSVELARLTPGCSAILILFDADDDCPSEIAPQLEAWAKDAAGGIPCAIVMANREYEAWFIASIESLRGKQRIREDADSHPNPETPRNAKGQLEKRMLAGSSYQETADQAPLTAAF